MNDFESKISLPYLAMEILRKNGDWMYGGTVERELYNQCLMLNDPHKEAICHRHGTQKFAKDGYTILYNGSKLKMKALKRFIDKTTSEIFDTPGYNRVIQYKYDFANEIQERELADQKALRSAAGI